MNQSTIQAEAAARGGVIAPTGWRVRFIAGGAAAGSARVIRQFVDPVSATAVIEALDVADLHVVAGRALEPDELLVLVLPGEKCDESMEQMWLSAGQTGANQPVRVTHHFDKGRICWRPGRAIIQGQSAWAEQALAALCEFVFYEGELRKLEGELPRFEEGAQRDVPLAYRPSSRYRTQWDRLGKTLEELARLRLRFARLEPRLLGRPTMPCAVERRISARLCRAAAVADRLEAFTNRLEACEDLYEGAVDRITDHRWYVRGSLLEIIIILLLLVEVIQIGYEVMQRVSGH